LGHLGQVNPQQIPAPAGTATGHLGGLDQRDVADVVLEAVAQGRTDHDRAFLGALGFERKIAARNLHDQLLTGGRGKWVGAVAPNLYGHAQGAIAVVSEGEPRGRTEIVADETHAGRRCSDVDDLDAGDGLAWRALQPLAGTLVEQAVSIAILEL